MAEMETPDPTPMAVPARIARLGEPSHVADVRRLVEQYLSQRAHDEGHETIDEADDLEIEDDPDALPWSRYEIQEMHEDAPPGQMSQVPPEAEETRPEAPSAGEPAPAPADEPQE